MSTHDETAAFKELEWSAWDRAAPSYDTLVGHMTSQAARYLLDATRVTADDRVLDVACGPGYVAGAATERGAKAVGVDFVPAMVDVAAARVPAAAFSEGDAQQLTFDDASFDAVLCAFGVLHIAKPERAFAEAFRVLHPDGRYAFTVWDFSQPDTFMSFVVETMAKHADPDLVLPPGPRGDRFSDADEAIRVLTATGFTDVHVETIPIVWRCQQAGDILAFIKGSSARAGGRLALQTPERRATIEAALIRGAEQFRKDGAYEAPSPAVLVTARKP